LKIDLVASYSTFY